MELALVAAIFLADELGYVWFSKTLYLFVLAVASFAFRRVSWKSIGFRVWRSCPLMLVAGIAIGAGMEAFQLFVSQPALMALTGEPPDLSDFAKLKGNLEFAAVMLALVWVVAAFGEEFVYRGYLLNRLRDFFAPGTAGTLIALVASSAIFGSAHAYQGITGYIDEGLMGLILGIAYLATGRNLVVPMIAHGVQDTIDLWLLYSGTYPTVS